MSTGTPCIVLAGGLGTRLGDVLQGLPKCLAPVGGRSFLSIQLDALAAQGIGPFVLALGHAAEPVMDEARALRARHVVDWVVEPERLGTGGAALYALNECGLDEALVTNGDTHLSGSLAALLPPLRREQGEILRMATVQLADRRRFGGLVLEGDRVVDFLEKGAASAGAINAGIYRLARAVFGARHPGQAFSLETEVLPGLARQRRIGAAPVDGSFIDIGVPEDYSRYCREHGGA